MLHLKHAIYGFIEEMIYKVKQNTNDLCHKVQLKALVYTRL